MPSEEQKPKIRKRAFAPKVRSGCLTCKKRHRKCDEEKPTCRRCKDGGYICDGYAPKPDARKSLSSLAVIAKERSVISPSVATSLPPRCFFPGDALETHYLGHFWTTAVQDLEFSNMMDASFWRRCLGNLSQQVLCVRHAIIAFGVSHWLFITPAAQNPSLEGFAVLQYNRAISHLVPLLNSTLSSTQDLTTVLTCCMLFVLLECMRGNYGEAFRHLESGSRLITDRLANSASVSQSNKELAFIFDSIACQASLFSNGRVFPDLSDYLVPLIKYPEPAPLLRDLDEAEDVMNAFDDTTNYIYWDLEPSCTDDDPSIQKNWLILEAKIQSWATRFDRLVESLTENERTLHKEKIMNLKVQHRMWLLLLAAEMQGDDNDQVETDEDEEDDEEEYELPPEQCNEILDEVELLWNCTARPTFTLKVDQISSIIQLYAHCSEVSTRQRIISILRSRKRREIIWHSEEVADFLEKDMIDHVLGIQPCNWPEIGPSDKDGAMLPFRPRSSAS